MKDIKENKKCSICGEKDPQWDKLEYVGYKTIQEDPVWGDICLHVRKCPECGQEWSKEETWY